MAKVAADFEKIINTDRSRKKNTALAAKIFGKDRRASAPGKTGAGVQKRVSSASVPRPAGNINTEWTHDLHDGGSGNNNSRKKGNTNGNGNGNTNGNNKAAAGSLASRVSRPGEAPKTAKNTKSGKGGNGNNNNAKQNAATAPTTRVRQQRRAAQVANALNRAELQHQSSNQSNASGLSIRGIAAAVNEPLVVMAQNFAPGTTAADIESAMTPVGGLVSSCRILKTTPLVIAEIVFESREGAERVIETFNNQTADGRILHVYPKAVSGGAGGGGVLTPHNSNTPTAVPAPLPRQKSNGHVVDGSLGFDDPMDTDGFSSNRGRGNGGYNNNNNNGNLNGRLYSDDLVGSRPPTGPSHYNRRGHGGRR